MTSTSANGSQDRQAATASSNGRLAARSRKIGAQNEAAILEALRAAGTAGLSAGELAERVPLPERTIRATVGRLVTTGTARRAGERGRIYAVTDDKTQAVPAEDVQASRAVDVAEQRWVFAAKRGRAAATLKEWASRFDRRRCLPDLRPEAAAARECLRSADVTTGYPSRWVVIPFPNDFTGREDRGLDARISTDAERRGITAKAVPALRRLMARGNLSTNTGPPQAA